MSDNSSITYGYVVELNDNEFLTGFSQGSMWPRGGSIIQAKIFEKSITAEYAEEICRQKLNDSYDPQVKEITININ